MERKKICKIMVGSYLYGTSGPNSDRDYAGVFLPSRADLLALKAYPTEISESVKISEGARNSAGDIDCKYFSLSKFFLLATQGQPGQLELLFARDEHHAKASSAEWQEILSRRPMFLSKQAIIPFLGFAEAQAHKAVIKGENLENLQRIIAWSQATEGKLLARSIKEHILEHKAIGPVSFQTFTNASGAELIEIAGRSFDIATPVKRLVEALIELEKKYGTRSRLAASIGVDWKSIHHAIRLTYEAEDLLKDGVIHLPFTGERLKFLCQLKQGLLPDFNWSQELKLRIEHLNRLVQVSQLPDVVDMEPIAGLHADLVGTQLKSSKDLL